MFKLFYFNILIILATLIEGKSFTSDLLDDNNHNDKTSWKNMWFPHPPNFRNEVKPKVTNVAVKKSMDYLSFNKNSSDWPGLWFPLPSNYSQSDKGTVVKNEVFDKIHECDSGKNGIGVDFDPQNIRHSYNYLCIGKISDYAPNLNTSAFLREYFIPAAYEPPVKCLNESIEYTESLPTFGAYRPLVAKFGTYKFLPPQRWMANLANGAIVLLYHPCAYVSQIEKLQNTVKGCLYRHIITPSQLLTPQYPLALLAWGKSLQMSVVDDALVVKFIRDNAKIGFRQKHQNLKVSMLYDAGLMNEAHLITDEQDKEICGYKEMR